MLSTKKLFVLFLSALMVFLTVSCNAPAEETPVPPTSAPEEVHNPLLDQYPAFFGLDTANGLTVFVTSYGQGSYSCTLYPTGLVDDSSTSLWDPNSVDIATMKEILAVYNLPADAITVTPYQSLHSSHIAVELMKPDAVVWLRYELGLGEKPVLLFLEVLQISQQAYL